MYSSLSLMLRLDKRDGTLSGRIEKSTSITNAKAAHIIWILF